MNTTITAITNTNNTLTTNSIGNETGADMEKETSNGSLIHFIVMILQPSIGALLTLLAILVITKQKRLLRRISNKFLVNLFFANCFASISMVAYAGMALHHINHAGGSKNLQLTRVMLDEEVIFYIVVVTSMILSLINRMAVTLDRLLAIKKPFLYAEKFTTNVFFTIVGITQFIALSYFVSLILCHVYLEMQTVMYILEISFITVIVNGFLVLTLVNFFIFFEARKQLRAIAGTSSSLTRKKQMIRREYRLVCICLGIVLTFELCWTPCLVWFTYNLIHNDALPDHFQFISCHLLCLNNILDPVIYGWLSKDVKRELKSFFLKRRRKKSGKKMDNLCLDYSDASITINYTSYAPSEYPDNRYSTML